MSISVHALGVDRNDVATAEVSCVNGNHLDEYRIARMERRLHGTAVNVVSLNYKYYEQDTDQKADRHELDRVEEHVKCALLFLGLFLIFLLVLVFFVFVVLVVLVVSKANLFEFLFDFLFVGLVFFFIGLGRFVSFVFC